MIALQALAILESAVLECKQRSIDTPEVMEALDLLAPHIQRQWVILQFRSHLHRDREGRGGRGRSAARASRNFPWYPRIS